MSQRLDEEHLPSLIRGLSENLFCASSFIRAVVVTLLLSMQIVLMQVYTVGPKYAHAEARKSPALDGIVERDETGKELRYPVILKNKEKQICT